MPQIIDLGVVVVVNGDADLVVIPVREQVNVDHAGRVGEVVLSVAHTVIVHGGSDKTGV